EEPVLVDPDAGYPRELQFAARVELEAVDLPRFVMDENGSVGGQPEATVTEAPHSDAPPELPEPVGRMSSDGEDRQVPRSLQDASDLARTAYSWTGEGPA